MNNKVIPIIESVFDNLTPSEKRIAKFFISNSTNFKLSAKEVARNLNVSESSLTRFSKKCGFSGYREFIYEYRTGWPQDLEEYHEMTRKVLSSYDELLNKTHSLIDERQIERIINLLSTYERVYFHGVGSSGLVAQEMKFRFMRLGLRCDTFTDHDMIKMNGVLLNSESLLISLSVSSHSGAVISAMKQGRKNGAKTILITASEDKVDQFCDEVVLVAKNKNLNYGNKITPQLPLLILVDIIYGHYANLKNKEKNKTFYSTLTALEDI